MAQLFNNYYFIKLSCPSDNDDYKFGNIVENLVNQNKFDEELVNIPYRLDDAGSGDIFFLQIGGDSNNKRNYFENSPNLQDFDNGIYGIGVINDTNPEEKKLTATFYGFSKPITKKNLYFYPQFIDSLGASTKGIPNQAGLYQIDEGEAKSFIDYLKKTDSLGIADEVLNEVESDGYLYRLAKEQLSSNNEIFSQETSRFLNELSDTFPQTEPPIKKEKTDFDISKAIESLSESGLIYSDDVISRFIISLMTKPFVILSGLSGSGKTQLALSFVNWICGINSRYQILRKALNSDKIEENYKVVDFTSNTVELINKNGSSGTIIPLPVQLIFEWFDAVIDGELEEDDDPKDLRHDIGDDSQYQKHMHGFYNDLSKLAFAMKDVLNENSITSSDQYKVVAVGADWTNREPLLGYPNALEPKDYILPDSGVLQLIIDAKHDPDRPYFLILDEMNMSHVERYFADFLSAIESGEEIQLHSGENEWNGVPPSIKVPNNLFVIGTVNIDETTYMFSPKVLDRANVIEFRVKAEEIERFLQNPRNIDLSAVKGKGAHMAESFVDISITEAERFEKSKELNDELMNFFNELKKTGTEFGYRSALEMNRFASISDQLVENWDVEMITDIAVMQKLLPKLHGSRRKLKDVLEILGVLCLREGDEITDILNDPENFDFNNSDKVKYPISLDKISRMYSRVMENGFTSYAEA